MTALQQRFSSEWWYRTCWIILGIAEISYLVAIPERFAAIQMTTINPLFGLVRFIIEYMVVIIFSAFAFLILRQVRHDGVAQLTAIIMVIGIPNFPVLSYYASLVSPLFIPFSLILFVLNSVLVFWWLLIFPDGKLYARWALPLLPIVTVWEILRYTVFFIIRIPELQSLRPYALIVTISFPIIGILTQLWRFRRISTPDQRQQTKWILLPLSAFFISSLITAVLQAWSRGIGRLEITLAVEFGYTAWVLVLSIFGCVALWRAITRQGLWQLDFAINRSLVALGVSATLGVIFFAVFFVLQALLRLVFGINQGELAVGISAVVSVLLFQNVRHRIRYFVDRRIYRLRFDLDEVVRKQKLAGVQNPGVLTGKVVGDYELLGMIGSGGMGAVYKAVARSTQQIAALKILKPELLHDTAIRQRFEREGTISLQHPNIVKTYGYGTSDDIFYIALEYLDGPTLKDIIRQRGQLEFEEIRDFLPSLVDALDTAHTQGYIHRDLKPANIGLRLSSDQETYEAVLMDFGIAKIIGRDTSITGTDAIGTIDYMSPEQINEAHSVGRYSDIYALGVLLYELITGDVPFKGGVGYVIFAHLNQPPPDPREKVPQLPEAIAHAIMKAMAKNPQDRFQSGREFLNALV